MRPIQMGHNDVIRPRKLESLLPVIRLRSGIECAIGSVLIPGLTAIFKPRLAPPLPPIIIALPFPLGNRCHLLLDRRKNLAGGNKSDAQLIPERKDCFIEETTVQPNYTSSAESMGRLRFWKLS